MAGIGAVSGRRTSLKREALGKNSSCFLVVCLTLPMFLSTFDWQAKRWALSPSVRPTPVGRTQLIPGGPTPQAHSAGATPFQSDFRRSIVRPGERFARCHGQLHANCVGTHRAGRRRKDSPPTHQLCAPTCHLAVDSRS